MGASESRRFERNAISYLWYGWEIYINLDDYRRL